MRRISLTNLETLCWIARLGSFTAAAQRLNATQPAISGRVRELEQSLRVSLFQKRGRKMELTIQGRELVEQAQPLLSRIEELITSLDNPAAISGIVRIGVGEMVSVSWFGSFMAQLHALIYWSVYLQLPRLNQPTLIVHGLQDQLIPPANGRMLASRLKQVSLVELPAASHWLMTDCNAACLDALGEHLHRHR